MQQKHPSDPANPDYSCRIFGLSNCEPDNKNFYQHTYLPFRTDMLSLPVQTCKPHLSICIIFLEHTSHRLNRLCIVETEITIIKATGGPCCDREAIQSSQSSPGCSSVEARNLELEIIHRDTRHAFLFHEKLMDNGPHRVTRRIAIGPWRPGYWRGGWRERLTRVSKPKLKHEVEVLAVDWSRTGL